MASDLRFRGISWQCILAWLQGSIFSFDSGSDTCFLNTRLISTQIHSPRDLRSHLNTALLRSVAI